MRLVAAALTLMAVAGCETRPKTKGAEPGAPAPVESLTSEAVVTDEPPVEFLEHVKGAGYEGWIVEPEPEKLNGWPLGAAEVAAMESKTVELMRAAIAAGELAASADLPDRLASHVRRYEGIVMDGSKRILVNYVCPQERAIARRPRGDGNVVTSWGECLIRGVYDIESARFVLWKINNPQ